MLLLAGGAVTGLAGCTTSPETEAGPDSLPNDDSSTTSTSTQSTSSTPSSPSSTEDDTTSSTTAPNDPATDGDGTEEQVGDEEFPVEVDRDNPYPIDVISRLSWGATPAGDMASHDLRTMTIHHTASPEPNPADAAAQIWSHQQFHQGERGWADIAYHFLIGPTGEIYEGRHYSFAGETGTNYDPAGHFLVAIDGDFSGGSPNDAQIQAAAELFAWAAVIFELPVSSLGGHRDFAQTACPGDALYSILQSGRLEDEVNGVLVQGFPELNYV